MALLGKLIKEALIKQASQELAAFTLYKEASCWFDLKHFSGIAKKLNDEADSEKKHFDEILSYLTLRGEEVEIIFPEKQKKHWTTERSVFEFFLALEQENTQKYVNLIRLARQHEEFDVERFLAPFLKEQYESVDEWEGRVEKVKSFSAVPGLIWHLDHYL